MLCVMRNKELWSVVKFIYPKLCANTAAHGISCRQILETWRIFYTVEMDETYSAAALPMDRPEDVQRIMTTLHYYYRSQGTFNIS
jgi:hypothetical protein